MPATTNPAADKRKFFPQHGRTNPPDYLKSVTDDVQQHSPIQSEAQAEGWLTGRPQAFCDTTGQRIAEQYFTGL